MSPQLFLPAQEPWLLLGPASCRDAVPGLHAFRSCLGSPFLPNQLLVPPASGNFSLPPTLMSNAQSDVSKLAAFREGRGEAGLLFKSELAMAEEMT